MEPNELRIGNYVISGSNEKAFKIYAISQPQILALQDINESDISQEKVYATDGLIVKPIPITEEWFLKLGFKKNITSDLHPTYNLGKLNINDNIVYVSGIGFINHIKYIHQLQNLYFALTNTELTINEQKHE